jgi:hypothetical protein
MLYLATTLPESQANVNRFSSFIAFPRQTPLSSAGGYAAVAVRFDAIWLGFREAVRARHWGARIFSLLLFTALLLGPLLAGGSEQRPPIASNSIIGTILAKRITNPLFVFR